MPFSTRLLCKTFLLLPAIYLATGCNAGKEEAQYSYNEYRFDSTVIQKLPLYDSLVSAIIEKMPVIYGSINKDASYQAFRYMPTSTEQDVFTRLPAAAEGKISEYYKQLGNDYIYGFDVFKDSSIKIYIRSRPSKTTSVTIEENLSYYPTGKNYKKREFPARDTIINDHWQYWTFFNSPNIF